MDGEVLQFPDKKRRFKKICVNIQFRSQFSQPARYEIEASFRVAHGAAAVHIIMIRRNRNQARICRRVVKITVSVFNYCTTRVHVGW